VARQRAVSTRCSTPIVRTSTLARRPPHARSHWLARRHGWTSQRRGLSPARIAERGGRARGEAQARLAALLKARGQRAVRLGAMSAVQARALYADQLAALPAFMSHTYRTPSQEVSFLCRPH
jgi:signal transduction histidine kinase